RPWPASRVSKAFAPRRVDDALGKATAKEWLEDMAEAMAVARLLGDRIVLVGTSTGATLAVLGTQQWAEEISGLILVSPNFGVKDPMASVLEWPWSHLILPLFIPSRSWEPANGQQAKYWTHRYDSPVLFQMQALVRAARTVPFEKLSTPALFIASPSDDVVSFAKTREVIARWPAKLRQVHEVTVAEGQPTHVILGDIMNPEQTGPLADVAEDFLRRLLEDTQ
ncbi:MAG: alpha/beta fold hydrolase, partial [Myxococcota bacterium]